MDAIFTNEETDTDKIVFRLVPFTTYDKIKRLEKIYPGYFDFMKKYFCVFPRDLYKDKKEIERFKMMVYCRVVYAPQRHLYQLPLIQFSGVSLIVNDCDLLKKNIDEIVKLKTELYDTKFHTNRDILLTTSGL